jgi:hypothetical protein
MTWAVAARQHEEGHLMADRQFTSRIGRVNVNWPQTVGYYGALALAVGVELFEPPLAIFIAAVRLIKMLNRPRSPEQARFVSEVLYGAAKPVGAEGQSTIWLEGEKPPETEGAP